MCNTLMAEMYAREAELPPKMTTHWGKKPWNEGPWRTPPPALTSRRGRGIYWGSVEEHTTHIRILCRWSPLVRGGAKEQRRY